METPKPKPPVKKTEASKSEKPKFVRSEHLMHRPFQDNPDLAKMLNQKKGRR